jgi:phage tail-like protein
MTTVESVIEHKELIGSWFIIDVKDLNSSAFTDIGGLSIEVGVTDVAGTTLKGDAATRRVAGLVTYGELSLKRNLTDDKFFYNWCKEIFDGKANFRKEGSIHLCSMSGDILSTWEFKNSWPSKWSASDLSAGTADPMKEEITLQLEFLKRTK